MNVNRDYMEIFSQTNTTPSREDWIGILNTKEDI